MRLGIAVVYNQPTPCRYQSAGEEAAVTGVLAAVGAVSTALQELGYSVLQLPLSPPLELAKEQICRLNAGLVFNLFEGFCGCPETEADLADILSVLGVPYTGSPGRALRLALDKARTSALLKSKGIVTPESQLLNISETAAFHLHYPCIIKPPAEDASHGISERSIVYNLTSLKDRLADFQKNYGGRALVEEFIDGREFNITVIGNSGGFATLPVSEIGYSLPPGKPRILTFAAKWQPDSLYYKNTPVICPARIDDEKRKHIEEAAFTAFGLLGCRGYARVDMRLDERGRLYVIEVNPNPDISPGSGAARQAEAAGLSYTQFIEKIVQLALDRKNEIQHPANGEGRQVSPDGDTGAYARV